MADTETDISRYGGDTYPNRSTIAIGQVPINIEGWEIQLRYKNALDVIRVVDCVITNDKEGKINIYPHDRGELDDPLTYTDFVTDDMESSGEIDPATGLAYVSNQCWTSDDEGLTFPFSIIRRKTFDDYEEIMTHNVGEVIILARI